MIKGILLDIGGVLYEGETPLPGAKEALERLMKRYKVRFLSNTSRKSPKALMEKLERMGFGVDEEELFTALRAAKSYLSLHNATAYIVGTDDAKEYFGDLQGPLKYVLVCDAYRNFTYENLNEAFRTLMDGARLLATNENRYFKDDDGLLSLDAGGFVKCLEYASEQKAKILGKPDCSFFSLALRSMGVSEDEAIMVGDDIEGDILGAKKCGIRGVLVKTGKFRSQDLQKGKPDFLIESIVDLPKLLEEIDG